MSYQTAMVCASAGLSFVTLSATARLSDACTAARSAAKAGEMTFMAAPMECSAGLIGGSGFLAISAYVELRTELATSTGCP